MEIYKATDFGKVVNDDALKIMSSMEPASVDLIFTSPPFDLIRKKSYGNKQGAEYQDWISKFGVEAYRVLKDTGSLVMDLGGSWNPGSPTKNLYEYRTLISFCDNIGFHLAQDCFWWNPSRLPSPAQWVTVEKVRMKDAINKLWWFSKTERPKSNNQKILQPYSKSMEAVLRNGTNVGKRPSGHEVSENFHKDNGGSIPPNLIALANTDIDKEYTSYCSKIGVEVHPARFPRELPEYFIRLLTEEGDTVLDPFAGSCTTGLVCEYLKRNWLCIDLSEDYLRGAICRFEPEYIKNAFSKQRARFYEISPPMFDRPKAKHIDQMSFSFDED